MQVLFLFCQRVTNGTLKLVTLKPKCLCQNFFVRKHCIAEYRDSQTSFLQKRPMKTYIKVNQAILKAIKNYTHAFGEIDTLHSRWCIVSEARCHPWTSETTSDPEKHYRCSRKEVVGWSQKTRRDRSGKYITISEKTRRGLDDYPNPARHVLGGLTLDAPWWRQSCSNIAAWRRSQRTKTRSSTVQSSEDAFEYYLHNTETQSTPPLQKSSETTHTLLCAIDETADDKVDRDSGKSYSWSTQHRHRHDNATTGERNSNSKWPNHIATMNIQDPHCQAWTMQLKISSKLPTTSQHIPIQLTKGEDVPRETRSTTLIQAVMTIVKLNYHTFYIT